MKFNNAPNHGTMPPRNQNDKHNNNNSDHKQEMIDFELMNLKNASDRRNDEPLIRRRV